MTSRFVVAMMKGSFSFIANDIYWCAIEYPIILNIISLIVPSDLDGVWNVIEANRTHVFQPISEMHKHVAMVLQYHSPLLVETFNPHMPH